MRRVHLPSWATMSGASAVQGAGNAAAALLATVVLGPEQRGVMVVVVTLGGLVGLLAGLGSGTAYRALLPVAGAGGARPLVASYTRVSLVAVLAGALLTSFLTLASAPIIDAALDQPHLLAASGLFAASQVLALQANDAWFAAGRFRRGSLGAAATSAAGFLSLAVLVVVVRASGGTTTAGYAVLAQGLGASVAGIVQVVALARVDLIGWRAASVPDVLALTRRGLPALGLTAGLALALRTDRYILGVVAGPTAVGVYSLAATLAEVPRLIPSALGQLFLREAVHGVDRRRTREVLRFAVSSAALGSVLVGAVGWVAVPWFGPSFVSARIPLVVLCAAEVCFATFFVASRGLFGLGRAHVAGMIGVSGAVLAVAGYSIGALVGAGVGVAVASGLLYLTLAVVSCSAMGAAIDARNRVMASTTGP